MQGQRLQQFCVCCTQKLCVRRTVGLRSHVFPTPPPSPVPKYEELLRIRPFDGESISKRGEGSAHDVKQEHKVLF
jgi:hypothetical protein